MRASRIREKADVLRLSQAERKHERHLQWAALEERHRSGVRLVSSGWFRRRVNQNVKDAVGKNLLADIRTRVGKLPLLLKIGRPRKP
jgi:hypothetical protein